MGLHLPEAPPADSDEEEDPEGAAAQRSRASIPMDAGQTPTCPPRAPVVFASSWLALFKQSQSFRFIYLLRPKQQQQQQQQQVSTNISKWNQSEQNNKRREADVFSIERHIEHVLIFTRQQFYK